MIEYKIYAAGATLKMVAEATGINKSTLRQRLKKYGALRTQSETRQISIRTGRHKTPFKKGVLHTPVTDDFRRRVREGMRDWIENHAKGYTTSSNGYLVYTMGPHKGRPMHCVVMEKSIGRRMFANECVHHINEDRTDNRIENLELMTRADHTRLHRRLQREKATNNN